MVWGIYINIQKQFDAIILDSQFELWYFGYSFGYITKYWVNFFQSSGHSDECPPLRNIN
jgi:hypothetical protein